MMMTYNYKSIGITLLAVAIILIFIAVGAYVYVFYQSQLSNNLNDWAAFGSYIGGVIGGFITPLALVGAVLALFQQHNSSIKDKNEVTAAGILKTIERLEDSIDNELKEKLYKFQYPDIGHSIDCNAFNILTSEFLFDAEKAIPAFINNADDFIEKISDKNILDKERFNLIESYILFANTAGKLKFMNKLIEKHKKLIGSNFVAIFYKKKYKYAVDRLFNRGYPLDKWDKIEKIE